MSNSTSQKKISNLLEKSGNRVDMSDSTPEKKISNLPEKSGNRVDMSDSTTEKKIRNLPEKSGNRVDMSDSTPEKKISNLPEKSGNRICPLCQSPVRYFYINLNEKFLMCENTECDFPFGHEELKIVKAEDASIKQSDDETCSLNSLNKSKTNYTASVAFNKTCSGIEKLNKTLDSQEMQSEKIYCSTQPTNHIKSVEKDKQILKNIEDIKVMNAKLLSIDEEPDKIKEKCQIKNEKWIENLKNLQEISGIQLLRPEEISLLKKKEPIISFDELKIDYGHSDIANVSSIRIEIHNACKAGNETPVDSTSLPDNTREKDSLPI